MRLRASWCSDVLLAGESVLLSLALAAAAEPLAAVAVAAAAEPSVAVTAASVTTRGGSTTGPCLWNRPESAHPSAGGRCHTQAGLRDDRSIESLRLQMVGHAQRGQFLPRNKSQNFRSWQGPHKGSVAAWRRTVRWVRPYLLSQMQGHMATGIRG